MKVVITGATGFIGRNLAESFHASGIEVMATGRSIEIGSELEKRGIAFRSSDIRNIPQFDREYSHADCMIHCAARAGDWGRYEDFYETNVVGTRSVIDACMMNGIRRLIFISSPSIYFTGDDRYEISEDELLPESQQTHYATTKVINERELASLGGSDIATIILRPRAVHGPYDRIIVPRILRMAKKRRLPMIDNGKALADITYVKNLVDSVRLCLTAGDDAWNDVYNITNGTPITVRDWFSGMLKAFDLEFKPRNIPMRTGMLIARIMERLSQMPFGPKEPLMTKFSVGYMGKSMTLSIDKARRKLGYSPEVSNEEGFKLLAQWYATQAQ